MQSRYAILLSVFLLSSSVWAPTGRTFAGQAGQEGATQSTTAPRRPGFFHILGSIVFTTLHVPAKLVTCVGTQAVHAVAYTGTFGVEGHYDGGTNGRDIGETARRSCTGSWIVRPSQVVRDYGE